MTATYDATASTPAPDTRWRTRDIIIAAIIGVAFGVVFWAWGVVWNGPLAVLSTLALPVRDLGYAVWLMPAVLAPLIIRKPGAAIFAEMVAAGLSALLGTVWGPEVLLAGFVQGAAAEVVFGFTLYRSWSFPVLAIAAVASAAAAWTLTGSSTLPPSTPRSRSFGSSSRRSRPSSSWPVDWWRCIARSSAPACSKDFPTDDPRPSAGVARGAQPLDRPSGHRSAGPGRRVVRAARRPHDAGRRAVRVRQEHARAGHRGPDPARHPGGNGRSPRARRSRDRQSRAGRGRGAGRHGLAGPRQPAGDGPGRGRRRLRPREPGLAATRDAFAVPGGARRGGARRAGTAAFAAPVRRTAATPGPGRCSGAAPASWCWTS